MATQTAVSVHEVVGATREAELVQPEKPKTRKGARVLPEKTETVVADVQVAYAEQPMEDFVPGQNQVAHPVTSEQASVVTSEVYPVVHETTIETKAPKTKKAKRTLPVKEAPSVEETTPMDTTATHSIKAPATESSTQVQSTQNALQVHQVVEGSVEGQLSQQAIPEGRKAVPVLAQSNEMTVTDVQLAFKETCLEEFVPGQTQSAQVATEDQKTVQVAEVHSSVKEAPLMTETPKTEKATTAVSVQQVSFVEETAGMDFTTIELVKPIQQETSSVIQTTQNAVAVQQVVEATMEGELPKKVKRVSLSG